MSTESTIRIASYNLRGLKDDPAAAAAVVRAIDPDVLLLQEVPRHPLSSYRISDFARRCDLLWSGRTRRLSGTSMMTSMRVMATDSLDRKLPVPPRANPRSYTAAQVRRPGGPDLTVVSIHLSLIADERLAHTRLVLTELAEDPALGDGPFVVGGDLNESADGAAWSLLGERLRLAGPGTPTYPAHHPHRCIDAVFVSTELGLAPHADLPLHPVTLRRATDHLPVWVDVIA
ncbi:endonuclease/exonuclease/phosphatase family protein [soil metagenome]|jgi:endonuclease/exonuclease/phosphatase family metal-dependent hydrolase